MGNRAKENKKKISQTYPNKKVFNSISRRDFIKYMSTALALPFYLPQVCQAAGISLETQSRGYPRAFAFRQSEVLANLLPLDTWENHFKKLSGVVGKLLPEVRKDTVTNLNIEYFSHFKNRFPHKMCLMHFNAGARLPEFETEDWYPGWWLYRVGVKSTKNVTKTQTEMKVEDASGFSLVPDAFGNSWQDIIITRLDQFGKPDFSKYEYARITAIDSLTNTLTIERAQYGSQLRYWPKESYVAAVVSMGPFYAGGNKIWAYNFATNGPKNPAGKSASDYIVEGLRNHLETDLAFLDGIELDVFLFTNAKRNNVDTTGDGIADEGYENGIDMISLGMNDYLLKLRNVLGPDRLLLTDGGGNQRPNWNYINGVELEGTPTSTDSDFLLWSKAIETLSYYRKYGQERAYLYGPDQLESSSSFSYAMYKSKPPLEPPKRFANFRLSLAAALFSNAAITYFDDPVPGSTVGLPPGPDSGNFSPVFSIWDELVGGALNKRSWLGYPTGSTIHLSDSEPDLYNNEGGQLTQEFMDDIESGTYSTSFVKIDNPPSEPYLEFSKVLNGAVKFDLPLINISGSDLVLNVDISALPRPDYEYGMPRMVSVTAYQGITAIQKITIPVGDQWQNIHLAFRRLSVGEVRINFSFEKNANAKIKNIKIMEAVDAVTREFQNGAVFANPSDQTAVFDVASLFPGSSFERLQGSVDQDTSVNNGDPVGASLSLPPIDALIVKRV